MPHRIEAVAHLFSLCLLPLFCPFPFHFTTVFSVRQFGYGGNGASLSYIHNNIGNQMAANNEGMFRVLLYYNQVLRISQAQVGFYTNVLF